MKITTKRQMYRMLADGAFGNTIPQYFSIKEWAASGLCERYKFWGVRSLVPAGPCRLNCPNDEVISTCLSPAFRDYPLNISLMIDKVTQITLWAEVMRDERGWCVYGIQYPKTKDGWTWRSHMPSHGTQWYGMHAQSILRCHLNSNSYADLEALLDQYPDHVVELSATASCFGTIPGRNSVVWECRLY